MSAPVFVRRASTVMNAHFATALPEGWDRFSRFFFALGERTRQQILLVFEPNEEICVSDIAQLFQLSRPAISHHLKVLRDAGLLLSEKRGKEVYYRVNYIHAADILRVAHGFMVECAGAAHMPLPGSRLAASISGPASWDRVNGSVALAVTHTPESDD